MTEARCPPRLDPTGASTDCRVGRVGFSATSTMTSTSTGRAQRQLGDADRAAGVPARPRRSTAPKSSEAPLIDGGLTGEALGAEATNPVTLTILTTRPRPTSASIAASALSAHSRASSGGLLGADTSAPTLPVGGSLPSTIGS